MKEYRKTKIKTISERDPEAFDDRVNEFTDTHDVLEMRFNDAAGGFCVTLTYMETTLKPENIRDEYELRGEVYTCGECPYYERPTDKRVKYGGCHLKHRTDPDGMACLWFYKRLALGEITPERGVAE